MKTKRWMIDKDLVNKSIKFLITIMILSIPFACSIQILGANTFIDSFEAPDNYIVYKSDNEYLVIQKATHPEYEVQKNDDVLHYENTGDISIDKINEIRATGSIEVYYAQANNCTIFENQVIGKVIKTIDENIITTISVNIWEFSIKHLNIGVLF